MTSCEPVDVESFELVDCGGFFEVIGDEHAAAEDMNRRKREKPTRTLAEVLQELALALATKKQNREEAECRGWEPTFWRGREAAIIERTVVASAEAMLGQPRPRTATGVAQPRARAHRSSGSSRSGAGGGSDDGGGSGEPPGAGDLAGSAR